MKMNFTRYGLSFFRASGRGSRIMVTDFRNNECLLEGSRAVFPQEMLRILFIPEVPFLEFLSNSEISDRFRKTVETGMDPRLVRGLGTN